MRLYIAGPMTGLPQFNFPAFDAMAAALRRAGHEVVSPTELDSQEWRDMALASPDGKMADWFTGDTWGSVLARDVRLLSDGGIEGVVVLPGFAKSRGARLETYVARLCGLPIMWFDGNTLRVVPEPTLRKGWLGDE